jgi:WD40 repeat protein/serine/threonine protein kinase
MSDDNPSAEDPFGVIADEFVEAFRKGQRPSVEEFAQRYPEHADDIREMLPALVMMEKAKATAPPGQHGPANGSSAEPPLQQLGDYQILREVGRGGMGVVYEAQQLSLGRHVAIKVLPRHALLDPRQLGRFQREARSAARLHHTNIVPVFGVGEQDGLHYYVMQFIPGLGLDLVLDELRHLRQSGGKQPPTQGDGSRRSTHGSRNVSAAGVARGLLTGKFHRPEPNDDPTTAPGGPAAERDEGEGRRAEGRQQTPAASSLIPHPSSLTSSGTIHLPGQTGRTALSESGHQYWQSVARVGMQVADALAHASSQGVLHRDIKPSNLLLDDTGNVWVTDFGLAKAASDSDNLTHTGDIVGTLRYMAPERFSGQGDLRSDIYSLGLTLYEMLMLRPAFDETNRNKLVKQVMHDEPRRPRQIDPAVPRDLETVVLKAIARDPAHRYQTAGALADDLQRFLDGRPITARPVGPIERSVKWVRRNKVVTGAALAVLLALVGGTAASLLKYWEADAARRAESQRVQERDDALTQEAQRVQERDAALDDARRQLSNSTFLLAVAAYDSRDVALARHRLVSIDSDYRGWEWHYFRRQATGGIFTLYGHTSVGSSVAFNGLGTRVITGEVTSVAFSPDGTRLLTGSLDRTAKLWDARTGRQQLELKGHSREIESVAFSPDGTRVVTGSWDRTAKVWDAHTGAPQLELKGHTDMVRGVAFSPDGTRIATASWDLTAKVWDAHTGKPLLEVKQPAQMTGVAFSPDGTRFVTAGFSQSEVWDARTGRPLLALKGHASAVYSVAFSPDGTRLVTGGYDQTAKVWDARTGTEILTLKGHTGSVRSASFSPDGTRIVIASEDTTARVWEARTGHLLLELKGHTNEVVSVAFSPDGTRLVTGSGDRTAKVWDASTVVPQPVLKEHTQWVNSVAFSPDGKRLVTGSYDRTAKVWDAQTGHLLLELKGHTNPVLSVAFSPDGTRIATASQDGTAKVWDAGTGTAQFDLKGHKRGVQGVAISPDGTRIVTGGGDGTVKVWDAHTGTPLLELKGHTDRVRGVAFSPDGTRIATASWDETAKLWDAHTGALQLDLKGHTTYVASVAFSPDGTRLATGSLDQTAKVWDAQTGKPLLNLPGHTMYVMSVAFSPDGTRIVTGSTDSTAKLWDARTGLSLLDLKGHTGEVGSVAFSPDGTRIVTSSSDQTARLWDAWIGTPPLVLMGHTSPVTSVAFSPDGMRIVTGSGDLTAKVWDARTRTTLRELAGHTQGVLSVAFSPDGTRIVTGSYDRTARVWDARTGVSLLDLKGHTGEVWSVAFSPDGTRIVTGAGEWNKPTEAKVWDAQSGAELKGEPIPPTVANNWTSPDGRFFAHPEGNRVELIPLQPEEEELSYRLLHTRPNWDRYREGYEAARAARDDFAARFHLNLLADGNLAAGRTQDALGHLAALSSVHPRDTELCLTVAALQAWFGREKDLAATRRRALDFARGFNNARHADCAARVCSIRPSSDKAELEAALAFARTAVQLGQGGMWHHLALGMAAYRSGNDMVADGALLAVAKADPNNPYATGISAFYRAMSLFRRGKPDEARQLAITAAAKMKPLPRDENNPLAGTGNHDDLILWLAYKEAKALIHFDAAPPPKAENDTK